jgi:arsenite-transporting ATPase
MNEPRPARQLPRMRMQAPAPTFLADARIRLLLFGGKGGAGKTSCATAAALLMAAASRDNDFLLVSTDPAHSVMDSLAGLEPPANLQVVELDAQACLAAFKARHGPKLGAIAWLGTFLDHDDIARFLELSLPGLDELMASLEIAGWAASGRFQTIVVDTAPTGHTLRLLAMPELLQNWLAALDSLLAKHRCLRRHFNSRADHDEMDVFLEELAQSVNQMESSLRDAVQSRFVPVMLAEEMSLSETSSLLARLKGAQIPVNDIIVNRLLPENHCPACADGRARQSRVLGEIFARRDLSGYSWWGLPLYAQEVCGAASLQAFWEGLTPLSRTRLRPATPIPPRLPRVETAARLPGQSTLLLFAGKGGVGKTTLACATGVRLAQDSPEREILLFSTDPAHSLADCLGVPVGSTPKRICPGLTALELDGEAEFRSFKQLYSDELRSFLNSLLPDMDLVFDRPAMERFVDLAPPGLDEVMALTRVMDLCDEDHYRTLVLDSAPTGHLIRLLEMPDLVDCWLKAFFDLLLKYKHIFRLPKIAQHLVAMSRAMKRLRALLADPARCALCAVAILTDMAFAETGDLLTACRRMRVGAPLLFLNLATPPGPCPLCSALRERESAIRQKFRRAFPAATQTVVYCSGEPRGLARLSELGQALYGAPAAKELCHA